MNSDAPERHWIQGTFKLLAMLGVPPDALVPNYDDPETDAHVMLAIPGTRTALAVDGDDPDVLVKNGWSVEVINVEALKTLDRVLDQLSSLSVGHRQRASAQSMMKSGSKPEERLLSAILRSNLPEPDRNYRLTRDNGRELTVPDFAWPSLKVAFFLDGIWWHVGKDDKEKADQLREAIASGQDDVMMNESSVRAQRDADIRSEMQLRGWKVLSCTDKDVETTAGVNKQVDRIRTLLRASKEEAKEKAAMMYQEPESSDGGGTPLDAFL